MASGSCHWGTDTVNVGVYKPPFLQKFNDTNICDGEMVRLQYLQPEFNYIWNTGETNCCIDVSETGLYIITAEDMCGNIQDDTVNVSVENCDHCIQVPNSFSPNGDGLNDLFRPLVNCNARTYTLRIFNRWGQCVFVSFKPEEGWNGTFDGTQAGVGVYFYEILLEPVIDGLEPVYRKGDITLIR